MARLILCVVASLLAVFVCVALVGVHDDAAASPFAAPAPLTSSEDGSASAGGVVWSRMPMLP